MAPLALLSWSLFTLALSTPALATPIEKRDSNLARDLATAEALKQRVTVDPQGITESWTGNEVCNFTGFYCAAKPDNNELAVASIDFNGYNFGGDQLVLNGFLDKLTDLALFHINSNRFFSGPFPESVLGLDLTFLDLRFNQFSGPIPKAVFSYTELEALFLNNNQFSGKIPHQIGFSSATYIALTGNQLTGSIPKTLASAPNLQEILLSYNQLSGTIPREIGSANNFTIFDAGFNQLTGGVPEVVCKLATLQVLNVTGNYLSKPLGPSCQALQARGILDVSGNCIPGADNQRSGDECNGQ
ncbi:hypothetical protein BKA65DRAFT_544969 [Rhexocercosporidium sp. MPI-PUGE-AT-0058]|nr:hypothetical protein BKA65DRAFT_544969 [Rhexocercosporidium sp. MPI-PUGE-AT-0058]